LLQLKHEQLVPSIHSDNLNQNIDFDSSVFTVQRSLEPWVQLNDTPRLAGVSGFGAGGSNAHLIVQEYVASRTSASEHNVSSSDETVAIVLSAKSEERLCAYAETLKIFLHKTPQNTVDLKDVAYTLQVGREPLNARLLLWVKNIDQLVDFLQKFIDGDRIFPGSYFGVVGNIVEAQEQFESNPQATESIRRALQNGDLALLARDWVCGAYIDWALQIPMTNTPPKIISLPTYPFARKKYWVSTSNKKILGENISQAAASSQLHPLVHKNISTIGNQCFSSSFTGQEFFFVDHQVGNRNIMPATAFLEMAGVASKLAIKNQKELIAEDILFVAPLDAIDAESVDIKITVDSCAREANCFDYTIFSDYHDNRHVLHSSGRVVSVDSEQGSLEPEVDVESIKQRCRNHITGDAIYSQFRENNFHYGTSFSVLKEIFYNQNEAFSTIEFPSNSIALDPSYVIHPSIMDGALQSLIGVLNADSKNKQFPLYVPFSISKIQTFYALPSRVYVYAVRNQNNTGQDEFIRFDIKLVDEDSRVLLDAKEVVYKKMKKTLLKEDESEPSSLKQQPFTVSSDVQIQRAGVESTLRAIAIEILQLDDEELHSAEELKNYGFDSVTFTEFANRISSEFSVEIKPTIFFDYHTLEALSEYFVEEHSNEIPQYRDQHNQKLNDDFSNEDDVPLAEAGDQASGVQEEDPVVIVGVSGVMPQSSDIHEFWQHLAKGENLVTEVPSSRWDWSQYYGDSINDPTKTNSKWGGFIKDVDKFDPAFFNMSPTEAEVMDPQQRLFLQEVWKCIEDAGYAPSSLNGQKIAVYVGMQFQEYQSMMLQASPKLSAHMATGNAHSILPNRVSYLLNLTGPSEAIDTACSSSLVAIHRAVQSIKSGEVETAIAGGVSLALSPETYVLTSQMGAYSPNGRCKTFDKDADGYVKGEGLGAVLLKRLSRAKADGDHVYAAIKSSVLNHGGKSQSLTAPSSTAQANLLIDAYNQAAIDPRTISYIETHGTGTALGDPIEIKGLKTAFKTLYEKYDITSPVKTHIGLGAVKTNTGHLEPAAGMAGLFKVLMAMKHKLLPGNANFDELNPYIELDESPFYIQKTNSPWTRQRDINGKIFVEHAQSAQKNTTDIDKHVVVLSAKTESSLLDSVQKLHRFVAQSDNSLDLEALAYTLQNGRDAMHFRLAITIENNDELLTELAAQKVTLHSTRLSKFVQLKAHQKSSKMKQILNPTNLEMVVEQWLTGDSLNWQQLYTKPYPKRISLPTYSFQKNRYWYTDSIANRNSITQSTPNKSFSSSVNETTKDVNRGMVYMTPSWVEDESFKTCQKSIPEDVNRILVFSNDELFIKSLNENRVNSTIVQVSSGESYVALENNRACFPQQPSKIHFDQLFESLHVSKLLPNVIVIDLPNIRWGGETDNRADLHNQVLQSIYLSQSLIEIKAKKTSIIYLSASKEADIQPQNKAFSGFVKTLELEESRIKSCNLTVTLPDDLELHKFGFEKTVAVIHSLNNPVQQNVLYSQKKRWIESETIISNDDGISTLGINIRAIEW